MAVGDTPSLPPRSEPGMSPLEGVSPAQNGNPMIKSPCHEAWRRHRFPFVGRLRRKVPSLRPFAVARAWRGQRHRPFFPQYRKPRPGARPLPRDPVRRRPGESPSADRRRPGGGARGAVEGTPVHLVSPGPRLLPVLLPERIRGGGLRRGDSRRAPGGGDRRELRPGPRRGQQPAQPGDRGPRLLRRPAHRGRPRDRVRQGIALPRDPPGRETFSGPRGHVRRLPQGAAGRPGGKPDAPSPRTAPLPPRRPRGDSRAHDRPRAVPRARPCHAGHLVPEDPSRPVAGAVAVSRGGPLRRAGDEGDRGSLRHRGGGGPRRGRRVRRRARVPGGERPGGDDRPAGPGGPEPAYVPAGGGGGGGSVGAASGVGGVERTLSAGPAGGGGGTASTAGVPPVGGLGKYRANISGR